MITCTFFLTLLLITVFGGKIEEEAANMHKSKESAIRNCTWKKLRESGSNNIIQVEETSDSRRRFSNLRFIKHNYFLEKSHHDQTARPPGCPPCRKFSLCFSLARRPYPKHTKLCRSANRES